MAINPLQPSEIEAWARLVDEQPTPWEIRTLVAMDHAFLLRVAKPGKDKPGKISMKDPKGISALLQTFGKSRGMKKLEGSNGDAR